jgi:vitamin B12 transporter
MITSFIFAAAAAQASASSTATIEEPRSDIVVTAALVPISASQTAASTTLFDPARIEAMGVTLVPDLIRLSPGVSVSQSGAQGSQTQIRVRGAEANHSLVFIDGIAFNDVAANNEARFETFTSAGLGRIELVRGPQSAFWSSEALGGVIAMETPDPLGPLRAVASGEYGSDDFVRGSVAFASGGQTAGVSGTATWARSDGIDILGRGSGDTDGFENLTLSLKGVLRPTPDGEIGLVGRYIHHDAQFDGTDPVTFLRADTRDSSVAETYAVRGWARLGLAADAPWMSGSMHSIWTA